MHGLTGTGRLLRLALRRDRIKLPLVIIILAFVFMSSVASTIDIYGSPKQQLVYAGTTAPSVASRVFGGPIDGANIGAIVLNETFLFTAVAIAFMSTLTVVRHTRQNEEMGRSELIESGIVSRHASLVAALIVAVIANAIFGALSAWILVTNDLPMAGSVGTGLAFAATGIVFAGIAAVTAQLADSARGANSMAAIAIGITFLLRAIGDSLGSLSASGLSINSAFPSWLSPIGWGQLMHPYTRERWWILGLFGLLFLGLVSLSVAFMARRDIGLGMIATKLGPAHAKKRLLSAFGLATRLQKGILIGWAITMAIMGVTFGLIVKEFQDLLTENEEFQEMLGQLGGNASDAFLSIMLSFTGIIIAGYATQGLMRMRSEEANGQIESVLGTAVSRHQWLISHVGFVSIGVLLLSVIGGLSTGLSYILISGESWGQLNSILSAAFVQSAAVFAFVGFVVLAFGFLPRLSVVLAWGGFAGALLIMQLGVLLELPRWVMNVSPFGHLPAMPAQDFKLTPVVWLVGFGVGMFVLGLLYFRHRDITTS